MTFSDLPTLAELRAYTRFVQRERLRMAVKLMKKTGITLNKAARIAGVPQTSLRRYLGKIPKANR